MIEMIVAITMQIALLNEPEIISEPVEYIQEPMTIEEEYDEDGDLELQLYEEEPIECSICNQDKVEDGYCICSESDDWFYCTVCESFNYSHYCADHDVYHEDSVCPDCEEENNEQDSNGM